MSAVDFLPTVIPAQAGIQFVGLNSFESIRGTPWIPAYAGMTA